MISELGTLLAYRFGHATAVSRLRVVLDSELVRRVYIDSELETGALKWWKTYQDQRFSFPDCVSFEIMRKTGISQAFSFDCDFAIAGFELIRSEHAL